VLRARNVPEGEESNSSRHAFRPLFDDGAGGRFAFLPIITATAPNSYSFILQCGEHNANL
jgi:hypothetical protein